MTKRLDTNLDRLAAEAGVELTPAIRRFAWLVKQDSLQGFWKAAQHYAELEQEKVYRFLKSSTPYFNCNPLLVTSSKSLDHP